MEIRKAARAVALGAALFGSVPLPASPDPFPYSDELREGVAFWKRVWAEWSLRQVVLHDDRHHAVIYEVFDLPGEAGDRYTDTQREYVKSRRLAMQERLRSLERKVAASEPLDDGEKHLALCIASGAGADAIRGAADRVRSQRGQRERFRRGLEISGRYLEDFEEAFREAGLPEDLAYLPHVESSFRNDARSSAGAVGIWQFTRQAARVFSMTVSSAIDERLDPAAAARGAARYFARAYDELGDWALAVTSFNHGIAGMKAAKQRFGPDFPAIVREHEGPTFGFASRNFYMEFLAAREIAKDPRSFFPDRLAVEPPTPRDRFVLDRPATPVAVARVFGLPVVRLAALNPSWTRRAVAGRAALPKGTVVWLPEGTLAGLVSVAPD